MTAPTSTEGRAPTDGGEASGAFAAGALRKDESPDGYGLVVPYPAYGFATLVPHNENLNSPKQTFFYTPRNNFDAALWLSSPSNTLSGSGSWDVRAHRLSTRARRTTSSGHIPNKKSQLRPARPEHHRLQEHHLHERKLAARMSVTGNAEAQPQPRTYVGQAGTAATRQNPQCQPQPPQSDRFWQGSS